MLLMTSRWPLRGAAPGLFVRHGTVPALLAAFLAVGTLASCTSPAGPTSAVVTSGGAPTAGDVRAGGQVAALRVDGGYVVEPASPSVAAAYLTITNTGSADDELIELTSPEAKSVKAMTEGGTSGSTRMQDLGQVVVPAGEDVVFTPGEKHLMLMAPSPRPSAGDTVPLTLVFRDAGELDLQLPVESLIGLPAPSPDHPGAP